MWTLLGLALANSPPPPVPARLVASVASVSPGQSFEVGVVLDVPEGWHVYWENPGDSGIATWVELAAPEGATVGGVRWPGPERFELPGGLVNLGYGAPVALILPVTAPAAVTPGGALPLRAEVGWLLCHEACVPGRAALTLDLPITAVPGDPTHALAPWMAALPTPFAEAGGIALPTDDGWSLTLPRSRIEAIFPRVGPPTLPAEPGRRGALLVRTTEPVDAVIRARTPDGPRYHTLTLGAPP